MHPYIQLGPITIPSYYLVISLAVCVCLFWLHLRLKQSDLSRETALDLSLVLMIASFVGSRLFHVFYENPEYYSQDPWRVLYFWDGGFVFYGGALLAGFSAWLFLKWKDPSRLKEYFDFFAPVVALSYALGRMGCVLAGCCYGRTCELPWSLNGRHPTALYASAWEFGVILILLGLQTVPPAERKWRVFRSHGSVFYLWMILHGCGRLVMESFRDDFRGPSLGLSISSWISLGVILTGLVLLMKPKPSSTK